MQTVYVYTGKFVLSFNGITPAAHSQPGSIMSTSIISRIYILISAEIRAQLSGSLLVGAVF